MSSLVLNLPSGPGVAGVPGPLVGVDLDADRRRVVLDRLEVVEDVLEVHRRVEEEVAVDEDEDRAGHRQRDRDESACERAVVVARPRGASRCAGRRVEHPTRT